MTTSTTQRNGTQSNALRMLEQHFTTLERKVSQLGELLASVKEPQRPAVTSPTEIRQAHLDRTRELLAQRGEVTVNDLRQGLGVSIKTATRLMKALCVAREAHLFFDPVGHTERLVLISLEKVALDRSRPN